MDVPSEPPRDAAAAERRRLIGVAYRLLGSLADAEDAVQETYARWYAMSARRREEVVSPAAWLTTATARVCLDVLGSARVRRERYVGQWLPEPLPGGGEWEEGWAGGGTDPADRVTLDESLGMAFLVVLDAMTPAERVAFVLHDVFRYPFAEVAVIVGRTPAACRQLASSARRRLRVARESATPTARRAAVVREFKEAWTAGDVAALVGLLDPGATATGDGGGFAPSEPRPLVGGERVAQALVALLAGAPPGLTLRERAVNGRPGLAAQLDGVTVMVMALDVVGARIRHVWAVLNPEKLRAWTADHDPPPVS
ncbi:RNA polymerase sigma factor SigJ [Streptomyces avicenniae]|uniref:RNA polymerase sigma factor SigJ n=1 Tax=Streptomyces avicenniae TaxID=500153 RepID=UPI00069BAA1D|nr:RNA polymerase sigma factor SigJ [Streptomyces avicenniae]